MTNASKFIKGYTHLGLSADKAGLSPTEIITAKEVQLYCALKLKDYANAVPVIEFIKPINLIMTAYPPVYPASSESKQANPISYALHYLYAAYLVLQTSKQMPSTRKRGIDLLYRMINTMKDSYYEKYEYSSEEYRDYDTMFGIFPDINNTKHRICNIKHLLSKIHLADMDYLTAKELLQDSPCQCISYQVTLCKLLLQINDKDALVCLGKLYEMLRQPEQTNEFYGYINNIMITYESIAALKYEEAIEFLKVISTDSPGNILVANNLMVLYMYAEQNDRLNKSLAYVEKMMCEDPTHYCSDTLVTNFSLARNLVCKMKTGKKTELCEIISSKCKNEYYKHTFPQLI